MERIKRFLLDDTATAEATSSVIMIASVGLLLAVAIGIYYAAINGFFTRVGATIATWNFGAIGTGS